MPDMIGQRWLYRIGNAIITVDNAFNWWGWGQERLVVNDEVVQHSQGWMRRSQTFAEPWLTRLGEGELKVRIVGQIMTVRCEALLDGVPQDPETLMAARWSAPKASGRRRRTGSPQNPATSSPGRKTRLRPPDPFVDIWSLRRVCNCTPGESADRLAPCVSSPGYG